MKVTKIFKRIKCEIMYRQATAKADYASKKNNGEIFYVLPTQKGNLMIMNRSLFEAFKKTKLVDSDMKVRDLFKDCVYHTNCKSEKGKRSRKRKFLRWKGLIYNFSALNKRIKDRLRKFCLSLPIINNVYQI